MHPCAPSGLSNVPYLQWGAHLAHFFETGDELRDILVPYFKAGLENNERCLWVTGEAFNAEEARTALRAVVPDLDQREREKQIEIANSDQWHAADQKLRPHELVEGLLKLEQEILDQGYVGLRTNGNCSWVSQEQWRDFLDYESLIQKAVRNHRMVCMCSYSKHHLQEGSLLQVIERHDLAVPSTSLRFPASGNGAGALSATAAEPDAKEPDHTEKIRLGLDQQKRTFDLAMTASQMGTWRYTLADNICIYDENAQRLYGLTESAFLHDEIGVKSKFHADDLELMWSRVSKALDPNGDGRYDVEYRVKQLDGSWRWLSAWGLVEFEGDGSDKKPVAIAGASRDLTELKKNEELHWLLVKELNHRVKNNLATLQAIAMKTLLTAPDLPSARRALDRRIRSMAQAHDLLSLRSWTGGSLTDVVSRALDPFMPGQVDISGGQVMVTPKHALALSLALYELATNAAKHGALSTPEGMVSVKWDVRKGMLHFEWKETGGPPVSAPNRRGFGSLLLEELVTRDLEGTTKLHYEETGVRYSIVATLGEVQPDEQDLPRSRSSVHRMRPGLESSLGGVEMDTSS